MTKLSFTAVMLIPLCAVGTAQEKVGGPVEIDFSPLPGLGDKVEYRIHVTLKDASGEGLAQGYKIGANTAPEDVADLVLESLPEKFQARRDGAKLIITSFGSNPIKSAKATAEGLPKGFSPPKVRYLPKK